MRDNFTQRTAGGGGKHRKTPEDGGGRHGVVRSGPWLLPVGQVQKMTGRDDTMPSVLALAQDGRTAPLRTLDNSQLQSRKLAKTLISGGAVGHHHVLQGLPRGGAVMDCTFSQERPRGGTGERAFRPLRSPWGYF